MKFTKILKSLIEEQERKAKENEFKATLKLFQALCS